MISYCKGLLTSELHIPCNYINALFTVTVRELIVILKGIDSLPDTLIVLDVAEGGLVAVDLADIVQQRTDRKRFLVIHVRFKMLHQRLVNIDAMLHQPAFEGIMVPCRCRRQEEIGLLQPFQQPVRTFTGNIFFKNGNRQKYCDDPECKKERNRRKSRTAYLKKLEKGI